MGQNKKVSAKLAEYCVQLIQLQDIVKYKYAQKEKENVIDVSFIDEEINDLYISSEKHTNKELLQIHQEEREWKIDYQERLNQNYEEIEKEKYEQEIRNLKTTCDSRIASLKELEFKHKEELEIMQNNLSYINTIPPIMNTNFEEMFEKIKTMKGINNDYLKLSILENLRYKKLDEFKEKYGDDISPELMAQIEYDEDLYYNEYKPLKEKVDAYNEQGITEEVAEEQLKEYLKQETPLYILNTNKLHLGQLTKSGKYMHLEDSEELFANGWNNSSVLFVYKDEEEEKALINYIKYLIFQCMGQMHPQALEVNVINPTIDSKFNDMLINTTTMKDGKEVKNKPYSTNYSGKELEELTQRQLNLITQRYKDVLVGNKTLTDLVKERRELGSKAPNFIINVHHRAGTGNQLLELSENSATHGVLNFVLLSQDELLRENRNPGESGEEYSMEESIKNKFKKDKIVVQVASLLDENETILNIFQKNNTRYRQVKYKHLKQMEIEEYREFMAERFKKSLKMISITRIEEYINQLLGKDLWSADARKNIKLYFGYVDGDKSKQYPVVIDEEAKVHVFMGGTTGGGKSVTLNAVVEVLKAMYPPSELDIYYYDFKKVEVSNHIKPYKWPNATAMSASETGDYLISMMNDIVDEMMERYDNMEAVGVTKLSKYQEFMEAKRDEFLAAGDIETAKRIKIPARTLIIIDEVQQAFTISDEVTEKFKKAVEDIARLARAAGLHMFFVSQDPGNKIPANVMDLFTIRACTKATPAVSDAVLKNKFAALPENQFIGFLGVNTSPTGDDEENIQYVVPLSEEPDARLYSKITHDMAEASTKESGNRPRDAVIFSDNDKYSFKKLDEYLAEHQTEEGEIVLGDIVEFQREYEPAKIQLKKEQIQGLAMISTDTQYKVEFFRTLMASVNQRNAKTLVFAGGDDISEYPIEELVKNPFKKASYYLDTKLDRKIDEYADIMEVFNEMQEYTELNSQLEVKLQDVDRRISNTENLTELTEEEKEEKLSELRKERKQIIKDSGIPEESPMDRYQQIIYTKKSYTARQYGVMPNPYRDKGMPDHSMVGMMKSVLEQAIENNKERRKLGLPTEEYFIIAIDPEKDPYVMQEGTWKDKVFHQLINEGAAFGVFFISITSNFDRICETPFNRYILGINPGPEASYHKSFRKLQGPFVQVANLVNPEQDFKFKMPTDQLRTLMPWEKE